MSEPASLSQELVYGCMTHIPLWFDFPSFVTPLYMGDSQNEGSVNLRDHAPEWVPHHPILGSLAGLFALKNYVLLHHPTAKQIGVCQYRKFISRSEIGVSAANYQVMNVVSRQEVSTLPLAELMLPTPGADFLLGKPCTFGTPPKRMGYLEQYNSVHPIEDLLRFTALAVELGVLTRTEVMSFLNQTTFLPGGIELGVYPAAFWVESVNAIEKVIRACVVRHPKKRPGYQARAWAFCAERLGSYMLLRHFKTQTPQVRWSREYTGRMVLVNADESTTYVGGV